MTHHQSSLGGIPGYMKAEIIASAKLLNLGQYTKTYEENNTSKYQARFSPIFYYSSCHEDTSDIFTRGVSNPGLGVWAQGLAVET